MSKAIRVEGISKEYRIGKSRQRHDTLRDQLAQSVISLFNRNERTGDTNNTIWALKDVSFEVRQGEVVGIIGRNGAGKSTLLKILSRITEPTSGRAEIHGRVGSLLEVGTGFHQELTGRENIFLNGAILGMQRAEINRKFDEIVDFAEVEKFIDTPVKRFSSGMYVRLAFAVAAHMETEVLLVDEVLAVGDVEFQKKCLGKMSTIARGGRTVLFVSHHLGSIASLCTCAVLLNQGRVAHLGDVKAIIDLYSEQVSTNAEPQQRHIDAEAYIQSARVLGSTHIDSGDVLTFEVLVVSQSDKAIRASLDWRLKDERGLTIVGGVPHVQYGSISQLNPGLNRFLFRIGPLPLAEGNYTISLDVDLPWAAYLDRAEDYLQFTVNSCIMATEGQSYKSSWGLGSVVVPFEIVPK